LTKYCALKEEKENSPYLNESSIIWFFPNSKPLQRAILNKNLYSYF